MKRKLKKKLYEVKYIVEEVLDTYAEARESDDVLFLKVCEIVSPIIQCPLKLSEMSVTFFLKNCRKLGFPSYETVGRNRRKYLRRNRNGKNKSNEACA